MVTSAVPFTEKKWVLLPESLYFSPNSLPVDLYHPSTGIFSAKIGKAKKLVVIKLKMIFCM